ncbi:MAG: MBL fold metallo-hydrolase [Polyangiaceae bacterium]
MRPFPPRRLDPKVPVPRTRFALVAALATAVAGCASAPASRAPVQVSFAKRDARIGTYTSTPWGFDTSSYWIEGKDGLVLVDTQFLLSATTEFVDLAERTTGKKAKLAIVLHPNPDKFNGVGLLKARGVRVVTSAQVLSHIPEVHAQRVRAFYDRYAPDYPKDVTLPESFGSSTTTMDVEGLHLVLHVLGGPGCSEAHVALEFDGHLFAGDLVANDVHSWLELGHSDAWTKRIDELLALKPAFVHPGRGPSGTGGLLVAQKAYLTKVGAIVAEEKPTLPITEAAKAKVKARIVEAFPGYEYDVFLDIGLGAEMERQAKSAAGR